MASSMIHYIIANSIIEKYKVNDENRFLLGNTLAPDASSHIGDSYNIAHFQRIDNEAKGIDWWLFEKKYKDEILQDDFYMGYWCHLIQDAIWLHDIVDKHIRIYQGDEKAAHRQMGYRDYTRLNYLLRQMYEVKIPQFVLDVPDIEEISRPLLERLYLNFIHHFDSPRCEQEELELYKRECIINYIEFSAWFCLCEIEGIKNRTERMNPELYFVQQ